MAGTYTTERALIQQILEGIDRQQFARNGGQLREPDDADLDHGRLQLSNRLRSAVAGWMAHRPQRDDLMAWLHVIADELMFLAAEMFALAHKDSTDAIVDWETDQFVGTLQSAISEARMSYPRILQRLTEERTG